MTIRAVIDTSALISPYRHELIFSARQRHYIFLWSNFLIAEVVRIRTELAINHHQPRELYRTRINNLIQTLSQIATWVDYTQLEGGNYTQWLQDPDDEPILATALVGQAHYVVSLNTKDFPPQGVFAGIRYVTPSHFFEELYRLYPERNLPEEFENAAYRAP